MIPLPSNYYDPDYFSISKVYVRDSFADVEEIVDREEMKHSVMEEKKDIQITRMDNGKWKVIVTKTYSYDNKKQGYLNIEI